MATAPAHERHARAGAGEARGASGESKDGGGGRAAAVGAHQVDPVREQQLGDAQHLRENKSFLDSFQAPFPPAVVYRLLLSALTAAIA